MFNVPLESKWLLSVKKVCDCCTLLNRGILLFLRKLCFAANTLELAAVLLARRWLLPSMALLLLLVWNIEVLTRLSLSRCMLVCLYLLRWLYLQRQNKFGWIHQSAQLGAKNKNIGRGNKKPLLPHQYNVMNDNTASFERRNEGFYKM